MRWPKGEHLRGMSERISTLIALGEAQQAAAWPKSPAGLGNIPKHPIKHHSGTIFVAKGETLQGYPPVPAEVRPDSR